MNLSDYICLPREVRTAHINLSAPCEIDESVGACTRRQRGKKALLEMLGVENDVEDWRKAKIQCCHICECDSARGYCANPLHTYIGTAEENCADKSDDARSAPGKKIVEEKKGLFDPNNEEAVREGCRKGGKKLVEEKKGLFDPKNAEAQREGRRKGGATTNGKKRICLVTGKISAPGPLAQYQKSRGIPTHLYTDLDGCDLVSQTMLMGLALM